MSLLVVIVGVVLMFAAVGWFSRQPAVKGGGWRLPAGLVAIGLVFAGMLLAARGGWIAGAPLLVLAVILGVVARARPSGKQRRQPPGQGMSEAEARSVLGLGPAAGPEEVRAAYNRLIRMNHPDAGGTDGLAAQLNAARDRLLGA